MHGTYLCALKGQGYAHVQKRNDVEERVVLQAKRSCGSGMLKLR